MTYYASMHILLGFRCLNQDDDSHLPSLLSVDEDQDLFQKSEEMDNGEGTEETVSYKKYSNVLGVILALAVPEQGGLKLHEKKKTVKVPDSNAENKDVFLDSSEIFTTDQIFESREALINWAKDLGKRCGANISITQSDDTTSTKLPSLYLSCKGWSENKPSNKMHVKMLTQCCPFQLRGVYLHDSNGKWKVKVHCGRHNHKLINNLSTNMFAQPKKTLESNQSKKLDPLDLTYIPQRSLSEVSINHFWQVVRPFIDDVHNVESDGHCGFRAVAEGLGLNSQKGWLTIREELIVELNCFKDEYMKIYGGEAHIKQLLDVLDCTNIPCPKEYWFTLPKMGHLVASRYDVVFVCISDKDALTFVPLRTPPPAHEPNVIAIGNVNQAHFVTINLKLGCPIPQPVKIWTNRKLAEGWDNLLKSRTDAFKAIVSYQSLMQAGDEGDMVTIE